MSDTDSGSIPLVVLIVNDDPDTVAMYEVLLSGAGMWVTASSEDEAAEYAADLEPDAIVADVDLRAEGSGHSFLHRLRSNPKFRDVPVFVVTGSEPESSVPLDVAAVFLKPVEVQTLLNRVEHAVRSAQREPIRPVVLRGCLSAALRRGQRATAQSPVSRRPRNSP
jgi:two-component system sensor histidine kinase/response regulator